MGWRGSESGLAGKTQGEAEGKALRPDFFCIF
jgi:hypothetical protein